jgi:L,D-transpeptidase ErfK/SrfK
MRLSHRSVARAAISFALVLAAVPATAAVFGLPAGQQVVGGFQRYVAKDGDVFADLARQFDIGYPELVAANPAISPWLPGAGNTVTVPAAFVLPKAPQQGIVINLGQWRLFYYPPDGGQVVTYPLGLGVIGTHTPQGVTRIVRKEPHPAWYPTASIRAEEPDLPAVVPPGPDNPLGDYALRLGWPSYLIHGTNKPDGVGRNVSHGCIRLYPEDIEQLFGLVSVGTPVRVVNQPATAGWYGDTLYLAVYPTKSQVYELDTLQPVTPDPAEGVDKVVRAAAGDDAAAIDWDAVAQAAEQRTGMPVAVGVRGAPSIAETPAPGAAAATPDGAIPEPADAVVAPAFEGSSMPSADYPDYNGNQ